MAYIEPVIEGADAEIIQLFGRGGPAARSVAGPPFGFAPGGGASAGTVTKANAQFWTVWHDIFGGAAKVTRTTPMPQAEVNQRLSVALADLHAAVQMMHTWTAGTFDEVNARQARQFQALVNGLDVSVLSLQGQVARLQATSGANVTAAVRDAVLQAAAHADALARLEAAARIAAANGTNKRIATGLAAEKAARVAGDRAVTTTATALARAEAKARTLAVNDSNARINRLATQTADALAAQRHTLEGEIAGALAGAEAFTVGLVGQLNVGGLASGLGALQGQVAKLAAETDECLAPLCDTVTPNANQLGRAGSLLKALEGIGIVGVLAGLVAEAVSDPAAAAGAVIDAGGWVADAGVGLAQAVGG